MGCAPLADDRLSQTHRNSIEDENAELFLSPISIWETHLLIEKNRLPVDEAPGISIRKALKALPVREAGSSFATALRLRSLTVAHQDPADRFIAATAIEMKASILTADERLLACRAIGCL